jgi:hypothetical protein
MGDTPFCDGWLAVNDGDWLDLHWCGEPRLLAREAMDEWLTLLRARCPWDEMPLDDVSGEFRAVVEELLRSSSDRPPDARAHMIRRAARDHGAFRQRQGFHAIILAEEVSVAEDAIAAALVRGGVSPRDAATFQKSLRPVMRAIERAMYGGYY